MQGGRLSLLAALAAALALATPLRGQSDTLGYTTRAPDWVAHFTTLSANALIGAVTGGITQELRGGSFKDGFARGALGGAVVYGGKRITAQRFFGAGLIGREVAAVGASMVRNASDGIGSFDRLILPAGFMRLYWDRVHGNVRAKVDIYSAGLVAYAIVEDHLEFDASQSLSSGAAVFRTDNELITYGTREQHAAGVSRGGLILRSYVPAWGDDFLERALAHERVHVAQDDQLFITLNDRFDDWLFARLGPARPLSRYVDLNGSSEFLRLLAGWIPRHADRPWELEAIYLTR